MNSLYYKNKYLKYKMKYINLQKASGQGQYRPKNTLPKSFNILLNGLKYGTEEIPFTGEMESLIITIVDTNTLYNKIIQIIKMNQNLRYFTSINFFNGPIGVKKQLDDIMVKLQKKDSYDDIINSVCNIIPSLLQSLETFICDWISTIPEIGPAIAFIVQNTKLITFNNFSNMYNKFPLETKKLFQHPELLYNIMNAFEYKIRTVLQVPNNNMQINQERRMMQINQERRMMQINQERQNIEYNKALSDKNIINTKINNTEIVATQLPTIEDVDNNNLYNNKGGGIIQYAANTAATPFVIGLHMTGLDKIAVNKIMNYMNKVLNPSVNTSVKALKLLLPLFFIILLLRNICNNS